MKIHYNETTEMLRNYFVEAQTIIQKKENIDD